MNKRLPLLCLFLFPFLLFAQNKFSMADAILKGRTALAPASLRQLQWIPGTERSLPTSSTAKWCA
jgi:hypothetical protein